MNGIAEFEAPLFVCECCGNIVRELFRDRNDMLFCSYCGFVMKEIDIKMTDDESAHIFTDSGKALKFQRDVFKNYVRGNKNLNVDDIKRRNRVQELENYVVIK